MHIYHAIGAFVLLYLYFRLEYSINDGDIGWNPYFIFQLFKQDVLWFIPGGLKRRTAFIKERFELENICIAGNKRNWERDDVVRDNLYEDCAKDTLSGPIEFWVKTIIVLALGALIGAIVVAYWREILALCFILFAFAVIWLGTTQRMDLTHLK